MYCCKICCIKHIYQKHNLVYFDNNYLETSKIIDKILHIIDKQKIYENEINSEICYSSENNTIKKLILDDSNNVVKVENISDYFKELIFIIIKNYYEYPNFTHFFNIQNIFCFLSKKQKYIKEIFINILLYSYNLRKNINKENLDYLINLNKVLDKDKY